MSGTQSKEAIEEIDRLAEIVASLPERWQPVFTAHVIEGKAPKVVRRETQVPRGTFSHWTTTDRWLAAEKEALGILARGRINAWRRLVLLADSAVSSILASSASEDKDRLKAAEIVYDRSGLPSGTQLTDPDDAGNDATPPLHTPEGREAALVELASLPPDLLIEALRRLREAAPEHLREGLPNV